MIMYCHISINLIHNSQHYFPKPRPAMNSVQFPRVGLCNNMQRSLWLHRCVFMYVWRGGKEGGAAGRGKTYLLYRWWVLRLLLPLQVIEEPTRVGHGGKGKVHQLPHSVFVGEVRSCLLVLPVSLSVTVSLSLFLSVYPFLKPLRNEGIYFPTPAT